MGTEKTLCEGVNCATGAGDVCQCAKPCPCWYSEEFEEKAMFTKVGYSAHCSSSLCFKPCHASSAL